MKRLYLLGLVALLGSACAHLPRIRTESQKTYFITESSCDGEQIQDYKRAERLRKKYPNSTLVILSNNSQVSEVTNHYHGDSLVLSGFYQDGKIDKPNLIDKLQQTVSPGSLVFLMSHGDPKLNTPNIEICPWNGWQEVRKDSPQESDRKIKENGAHVSSADLPQTRVYSLNCSANPQYLIETELDRIVDDILSRDLDFVYQDRTIKGRYITEDRKF